MRRLLLWFFQRLYHEWAWSYDLVAWTVSLGKWREWGKTILPFLPEGRLLELGFGPGHLHAHLRSQGRSITGLDESMPMCLLASRRLSKIPAIPMLARGTAQAVPIASHQFDGVFATFPSPFIFEAKTAREVERILVPNGKLVVLLAYRPSGNDPAGYFSRGVFRLTGQEPPAQIEPGTIGSEYARLGFEVEVDWHPVQNGAVLICQANVPLENHSHFE